MLAHLRPVGGPDGRWRVFTYEEIVARDDEGQPSSAGVYYLRITLPRRPTAEQGQSRHLEVASYRRDCALNREGNQTTRSSERTFASCWLSCRATLCSSRNSRSWYLTIASRKQGDGEILGVLHSW